MVYRQYDNRQSQVKDKLPYLYILIWTVSKMMMPY